MPSVLQMFLPEALWRIHEIEKRALVGHLPSVVKIVSLERSLCQAADKLLANRGRDGACTARAIYDFHREVLQALDTTMPPEET